MVCKAHMQIPPLLLPHCRWHLSSICGCCLAGQRGCSTLSSAQPLLPAMPSLELLGQSQAQDTHMFWAGPTCGSLECSCCGAHAGGTEKWHSSRYPHFHAKLNFLVLSRDIYRWESRQERVSVWGGAVWLLLTALGVRAQRCGK